MSHSFFTMIVGALAVAEVVTSNEAADRLPRVFKATTDVSLDIYRASSHLSKTHAGEAGGSSPWSPAGVYVEAGVANSFPYYTREAEDDEPLDTDMHLYRASSGIWIMTNNTENFPKDKGSFITSRVGDSPVGLKWRYHLFGRWPYDESLSFVDYTYEYDSHNYEKALYSGPPKRITRSCVNGTGNASDPLYVYTAIPKYFECTSNSKYCYNDSTVYCHFDSDVVTNLVEHLEFEMMERSASLVVLEDEKEELGGLERLAILRNRIQQELGVSAFRVYLSDPLFGFNVYMQMADAVMLFSVCASYGVAAGVFFSSSIFKGGDS